MKKTLVTLTAALLVAACSGGDDSPQGDGANSRAEAIPLTLGTPHVATISSAADYDYYRLTLPAPAAVRIQTFDAGGAGCDLVDTYVEVQDASGGDVTGCSAATNWLPCDDSGNQWCEDISLTLPAGDSYVVVSGYPPFPSDYRLLVSSQ